MRIIIVFHTVEHRPPEEYCMNQEGVFKEYTENIRYYTQKKMKFVVYELKEENCIGDFS